MFARTSYRCEKCEGGGFGQRWEGERLIISNAQARRFLLRRHGLIGKHQYSGKAGIMAFTKLVGCIQFDPVNVCGRNADIVLHSRIHQYNKEHLDELLYKDRLLVDYFDKNLSILPIEDYSVFTQHRSRGTYAENYDALGGEAVSQIAPHIRELIAERGFVSSSDVETDEAILWQWGGMASLPRAALESMYFKGELIVHHKVGMRKYYALAKDYVPTSILDAGLPFSSEVEKFAWHVKRRIGAVGLLWNKASDAWLGLNLKTAQRTLAFQYLLDHEEIVAISVEGTSEAAKGGSKGGIKGGTGECVKEGSKGGIKEPLYILKEELPLLEDVAKKSYPPRMEFIAPLDNLLWDRKLIKALFDFDYTWEIYTPQIKRKFGAYTLPILYGDRFVGRIDVSRDGDGSRSRSRSRGDDRLTVNNLWTEDGKPFQGKVQTAFEECLNRFAAFNDAELG